MNVFWYKDFYHETESDPFPFLLVDLISRHFHKNLFPIFLAFFVRANTFHCFSLFVCVCSIGNNSQTNHLLSLHRMLFQLFCGKFSFHNEPTLLHVYVFNATSLVPCSLETSSYLFQIEDKALSFVCACMKCTSSWRLVASFSKCLHKITIWGLRSVCTRSTKNYYHEILHNTI